MNISRLREMLCKNNVPSDLYSLEGGFPNEAYCINVNGNVWEVYYSERGQKSHCVEFDNELDACDYLLKEIQHIVPIEYET